MKIRSGFVIEQPKLRFTLFCLKKKQDYETYENRFFTNISMVLNLMKKLDKKYMKSVNFEDKAFFVKSINSDFC